MVLAPGGERGHQAAVNMGCVHPGMTTNLLKVHGMNVRGHVFEFGQPSLETQEAHTATFKALRLEADEAVGDLLVTRTERPTGRGAQINRQNCQATASRIRLTEDVLDGV